MTRLHPDPIPSRRPLLLAVLLLSACGSRTSLGPPWQHDGQATTDRPRASDGRRSTAADAGAADQSRPDPACRATTCAVVNDCCTCAAYDPGPPTPRPYCPATCKTSACNAWYLGSLTNADAYCLNGHCLLATRSCAGDADCVLVDDCCSCLAAPAKHGIPQCLADCNATKCVAMGLGQARARCAAGRCQLSLD